MNVLSLLLSCILTVEIILLSHLVEKINSIYLIYNKALKLILNKKISDHWKELAVPNYAKKLMIISLHVLAVMLAILSVFYIFSLLNENFLKYILSFTGISQALFMSIGYIAIRKFI